MALPTNSNPTEDSISVQRLVDMTVASNGGEQLNGTSQQYRQNLEMAANLGQNGILGLLADNRIRTAFPGMTDEQIRETAQNGLKIADEHFDGDVKAGLQTLINNRDNPQFRGDFNEMASNGELGTALQNPEVRVASIEPQTVTVGAQESGQAPVTNQTSTPQSTANTGLSSLLTDEQKANMQGRMTSMFDEVANAFQTSGATAGLASMEGIFGQIMEMFQELFSGNSATTTSYTNDVNAFAGVQTPNGYEIPTGSVYQLDPSTGRAVPVVTNDDGTERVIEAGANTPPDMPNGAMPA